MRKATQITHGNMCEEQAVFFRSLGVMVRYSMSQSLDLWGFFFKVVTKLLRSALPFSSYTVQHAYLKAN